MMMHSQTRRSIVRITALAAGLAALAGGAWAEQAAQAFANGEVIEGNLLAGWQIGAGQQMAGLHLSLAPEWKTYWRAPGDAGIPPRFDWSGSRNLASVAIHWPEPTVFHTNGMQSVGYARDVVLPLEITAIDPGLPVQLALTLEVGVCKDICIPATLALRQNLPGAAAVEQGPGAPLVAAALSAVPVPGPEAGLGAIACDIEPIADGLRLTARMDLPRRGAEEVVVFETAGAEVWIAESVVERQAGQLTATTEMVAASGAPFALDRSAIRITVLGSGTGAGRAADILGCPAP